MAYQIVSQDVINRWAYPLVPDMGIHSMTQQYIFLKNNIYKNPKAQVTKQSLTENVAIQRFSIIEAGSSVTKSVIGSNCKIGKNCQLLNAYLMNGVTVEDNCKLMYCVVGDSVKIGKNSELIDGTVIGAKCILPANTKLSNAVVKSNIAQDEDDEGKFLVFFFFLLKN